MLAGKFQLGELRILTESGEVNYTSPLFCGLLREMKRKVGDTPAHIPKGENKSSGTLAFRCRVNRYAFVCR